MEMLTKGEVTVTFKSQQGVVSEFVAQEAAYPTWEDKYWNQIVSEELTPGCGSGSFSTGDIITIHGNPQAYKIIGEYIGHSFQIVKDQFFDTHFADAFKAMQLKSSLHGIYGYGEGSRAERRAKQFKRRTITDGWNSYGKGLERGKQYYKGQKAGHY
jgi:hypothetical protein